MNAPVEPVAPAFVPGITYGMPEATYHAIPACGSSDVKALLRSPAHYRAKHDEPAGEESDALRLGSAIHLAVLEPERFEREVIVAPAFDRRTKAGKADAEAFAAEHAGRAILSADEHDTAQRVRDAVRAHPAAAYLLRAGASEVSLQWTDPDTGTPCKARLDWLCADGAVLDLKSARDASPLGFARAVGQFGYAVQEAHYRRGARIVLQAEPPMFAFVAVEKEPPYAVGVYVLEDAARDAAEARVAEAMRRHRECRESGTWPAYSSLIETLTLPRWAL